MSDLCYLRKPRMNEWKAMFNNCPRAMASLKNTLEWAEMFLSSDVKCP